MKPQVNLRPLEIDDFQAFLDIQGNALQRAPELFGSDYEWFEQLSILSKELRYAKYLNYPYQYLLGALDDEGRILGMVGFSCDHAQTKTRHKGRLWGMYVREEYRGKGLATLLLETMLESAVSLTDCEQVQLSVGTTNEASYGLYLRHGFSVYGTEIRALKLETGYADEYLMVKFLK